MRKTLALSPILIMAAACSAGGAHGGEGAEARAEGRRDFQVAAFDRVALEGSHDVIVTVGGAASVRAEGDSEALERLEIVVEEGGLKISSRNRAGSWFGGGHRGKVTVHVSVPALAGASIGGSGDMRIDRVQSPQFAASIGGSGDMAIAALRTGQANFSIAGSGGIHAAGSAERAQLSIAGSGDLDLAGLEARTASVSLVGSGDVRLRATESVEASIVGSGDVVVSGPARCTVSKRGSGDLRCEG